MRRVPSTGDSLSVEGIRLTFRARPLCRWLVPWLVLAGLLGAFLPPGASATTLRRLSLPQLTRGSQQIVIGRVERVQTRWNEARTQLFTDVTVEVVESIKGDAEPRIVLTQIGGELDDVRVTVPGAPVFQPGEEGLYFVHRTARGAPQVAGLSQGKFEITRDPATGRGYVQRATPGLAVRDLRLLRPLSAGARPPRHTLDDLVGEIRRTMNEEAR